MRGGEDGIAREGEAVKKINEMKGETERRRQRRRRMKVRLGSVGGLCIGRNSKRGIFVSSGVCGGQFVAEVSLAQKAKRRFGKWKR